MMISGRSLGEHIQLLTPFFGLIGAVWALRLLIASFDSVPGWLVWFFSVTIMVPVCIILATLLIHLRKFGGYVNVVVSAFCLVAWSQLLVVAAILFSVLTGIDNVYVAPEFSVPDDPNHTRHIVGHLTFGIGLETLTGSLMGCIILYMLRRTRPPREQ